MGEASADTGITWFEFSCTECGAAGLAGEPNDGSPSIQCPYCETEIRLGDRVAGLEAFNMDQVTAAEIRRRRSPEFRARTKAARANCPFCRTPMKQGVNRSDEHVLAEWLREVPPLAASLTAPRPDHAGGWQWTHEAPQFVNGRLVLPAPRWIDGRREHNLHVTVYVCTDCNNGWMSRLESQAQPLLTELITGSTASIPWESRALLARWAIKTAFAYERDDPDSATATTEQLDNLRNGFVPRDTAVWIGRWSEPLEVVLRHSSATAYTPGFDMQLGVVGSITFIGLGDIIFQVVSTTTPFVQPDRLGDGQSWEQVWPLTRATVHLPTKRQTRDDLEAIDGVTAHMARHDNDSQPTHAEPGATAPMRALRAQALRQLEKAMTHLGAWDNSGAVTFEPRIGTFTGRLDMFVDAVTPPPAEAVAAMRDAATLLREALDMTWAALLADPDEDDAQIRFPITLSESEWDPEASNVVGILPTAVEVTRLAQPFLSAEPATHPLAFVARASEYAPDSGLACLRGGATLVQQPDGNIDAYDYSDVLDGYAQRPELHPGAGVVELLPPGVVDPWRQHLQFDAPLVSSTTIIPRFGAAIGPTHDLFPDLRDALNWASSHVLEPLWALLDGEERQPSSAV